MELDKLIELAARGTSRDAANEHAAEWKRSEAVHREKIREANRELWIDHHFALAATHRKIALTHEQKAAALLEGEGQL